MDIYESNIGVTWEEIFILSTPKGGNISMTLEEVLEKLELVKKSVPRLADEIAGCESYARTFNANQESEDCYADMMRCLHDLAADLDSLNLINLYEEIQELMQNIRSECCHFYEEDEFDREYLQYYA